MKKVTSRNMNRNQDSSDSKLCAFSSLDYIVLASTLAVALGEELSSNDINILATFFAVLSDELALIASVESCSSSSSDDTFTAPTPDVAITKTQSNRPNHKNNAFKKKVIKKRIKRKKTLD